MEEATEPAPSLVDLLQSTAQDRHVPLPDLASPAASSYLDQLLSLPLKSLLDEATVISSEAAGVETELTNLCFREYPTFISVHKCSSAVTSAFDDFSSSLGKLLDAVPALEDECRTFVKSTKGVQDARSKALLVQEHQDKLFDLLEIPQLMDTCVRNGYYQEALELSAHASSLSKRYPGVELVQDVSREVDAVLSVMVAQLLALLREPIKLPSLIKTVGYLRRLGSVEETELGLVFLVSRLSNFKAHQNLLEGDRGDPVRYVRKYVDLFREHVFDIISQFTTIFLETSSPSPAAATHLASFVGQCVDDLVALVGEYVPKMTQDAASLSSILVQLGYCSLAFARVGLDFASLVTEPFNSAVSTAYAQALEDGASALTTTLKDAARSAGNQTAPMIAGEFVPALLSREDPTGFIAWSGSYEQLPTELSRFPPLAMLVNAHLSALNSLRLLAPLHLYPSLASTQSASLLACTHVLAQYVRSAVALSDSDSGRRAQLLRRTGERELTPEERRARRKETQWVCVALADSWIRVVCPLLKDALGRGVFDGAMPTQNSAELEEALHALHTWVDDQLENHMGTPSPRKSREAERSPSPKIAVDMETVAEQEKSETPVEDTIPTEEDIAALEAAAAPTTPDQPTPTKTPELVMETEPEKAEAAAEPEAATKESEDAGPDEAAPTEPPAVEAEKAETAETPVEPEDAAVETPVADNLQEDPPKDDAPKAGAPKATPPKEDPPKDDAPKEDPAKEDPPKEEAPASSPVSEETKDEPKDAASVHDADADHPTPVSVPEVGDGETSVPASGDLDPARVSQSATAPANEGAEAELVQAETTTGKTEPVSAMDGGRDEVSVKETAGEKDEGEVKETEPVAAASGEKDEVDAKETEPVAAEPTAVEEEGKAQAEGKDEPVPAAESKPAPASSGSKKKKNKKKK